jgi:hypothetical protein
MGMKPTTIKLVLNKVIENWLATVTDAPLKDMLAKNTIVSGGAITSMLLGEEPNDYDIYFKSFHAAEWAAIYYCARFNSENKIASVNNYKAIPERLEDRVRILLKSAGVASEDQTEKYQYFESASQDATEKFFDDLSKEPETLIDGLAQEMHQKLPYRPVFLTDNAITLANKIQLIIRFAGTPEEIHKNFDFVHAQCYYDYATRELVLPQKSLESILSKDLQYSGSLYPMASLFRLRKFLSRGWRVSAGQMLKIMWQINELDLENPKVLYEQLIGVDQAYMRELIDLIKQAPTNKKIDSIYIAKLIDEVWQ